MKKCQYIQGKKYEKQRNSEKNVAIRRFCRVIGTSGHRNLNGIYTDVFGGLRERKKSLKEIFNEIWPLARNQLSEFKRKYMSTWIVFFYIHIFL